ncbi:hypothetical protein OK016_27490 [Vibrio chagasii]|nr:hypothetical protein [Vibrio chagasii]
MNSFNESIASNQPKAQEDAPLGKNVGGLQAFNINTNESPSLDVQVILRIYRDRRRTYTKRPTLVIVVGAAVSLAARPIQWRPYST